MEMRCVKGMCRLKVVSSENNLGFKGFLINICCAVLSNRYQHIQG